MCSFSAGHDILIDSDDDSIAIPRDSANPRRRTPARGWTMPRDRAISRADNFKMTFEVENLHHILWIHLKLSDTIA